MNPSPIECCGTQAGGLFPKAPPDGYLMEHAMRIELEDGGQMIMLASPILPTLIFDYDVGDWVDADED